MQHAAADAYERLIGRWSRVAAPAFLDFVGLEGAARVLDVGCGTGALTGALLNRCPGASITGLDTCSDYLQACQLAWPESRCHFLQGDAMQLPFKPAHFDAVASMLLLMLVPHPERVALETLRVLRPGGVAAAATWDDLRFELIREFWEEAQALDVHAPTTSGRGHCVRPGSLAALWRASGFTHVVEGSIDLVMRFDDPAAIWTALAAGVGPAGVYVLGLSASQRGRLRQRLESRWSGRLHAGQGFNARLLVVRGRRPGLI